MQNYTVYYIRLNDKAVQPTCGSDDAAGHDLYACIDDNLIIMPGQSIAVPTGIAIQLPPNHFGGLYPRSGLALKEGLRLANCVGVIDSDYRGEVKVPIFNDSDVPRTITPNERIAQLIVQPYVRVKYQLSDHLNKTVRGAGGFGSTGKA